MTTTINITIATLLKPPVKKVAAAPGAWAATLTYGTHHKVLTASTTGQSLEQLALTALCTCLKALKRPDLPIHVALCQPIADALIKQQYVTWQQNDWQTKTGPVPASELWQTLIPLLAAFEDLTYSQVTPADEELLTPTLTATFK